MKIAKILSTCFKRGRVRENTRLLGDPPGYFSHSQNFTSVADTIKLLNYQLEMEIKYPPGLDRDLIIVNNDVGSVEGNLFIKNLNQRKIDGGKVISFTRENKGLSYGAYSDAFLKFKDSYDYFVFIEDDLVTVKKDYLKNENFWCHAKNLNALHWMLQEEILCFWHQEDDYTMTSNGFIWTYPLKDVTEKSIIVCKTLEDTLKYSKMNVYGICSDHVGVLK